jgi:hypothetical protein
MKTIKKDDLYRSLGDFLKTKGIEFKDGVYTQRINRACDLLTDAINETQKTVKRAKVKVDQKLDELRQSIHEATGPKPPPAPPAPKKTAGKSGKKSARPQARSSSPRRK